jgi:hypothetical protein
MIIKANQNPTKVLQPRKQAFYLPPPFVTTKLSTVLRFRLCSIRFVRSNHLGFKLCQAFIQWIRVVSLVANQLFRSLICKTRKQSLLDKSDFMRLSTFRVDGERKTSAVCHCHELRAFAPLGFSHSEAPFFATMNVPSIKHSDRSMPPRECKSSAKVSNTFFSVPSLTHAWNRRWQVWYGGNLLGRSHQRAPLRKIQSTPFNTSRESRIGLPRVWITSSFSKRYSIKDHCSSVNSSRLAIREVYHSIFEMASN